MSSVIKLLGVDISNPSYSTLCRRSKHLKINLKIKHASHARHVLVDSTGIQVLGESEWKFFKYGVKRRKCQVWRKVHIAIDANDQTILGATVTESQRLDGNYLPELIDGMPGPIDQITSDGAYDKKNCYHMAYKRKAKAVSPPQHNACVQRNNNYHKRSLVETMMFRMKSIFGDQIRSRTFERQSTDLLIQCYAINKINSLGMPVSHVI